MSTNSSYASGVAFAVAYMFTIISTIYGFETVALGGMLMLIALFVWGALRDKR